MKTFAKILAVAVALFLVLLIALFVRAKYRRHLHTRYTAEGQAAVEEYLRHDPAGEFTNNYGKFLRLEGSGFYYPVWNIQGYLYLTLDRRGYFEKGTLPIRIYVTEPRGGTTGTNLSQPRLEGPVSDIQGARIFIEHPKVKP